MYSRDQWFLPTLGKENTEAEIDAKFESNIQGVTRNKSTGQNILNTVKAREVL